MCTSTFSRLNSDPGNRRCTLVSSLQASPTELDLRNIKIYTHSFKIYGIWPQASKHTHARAQCSHASVGLTQARPNHCIAYGWSLMEMLGRWVNLKL